MNAQISFIDGHFSLLHIPLSHYTVLLQPILQILLPHGVADSPSSPGRGGTSSLPLAGLSSAQSRHGFLNISITPIECSVVCHSALVARIFQPAIRRLPADLQKEISISRDTYMVFSVSSAGMEAGQRVMDLTAPLAMVNIPIFFITTYYTDFILVPSRDRRAVAETLVSRGFEFSETDSAYVAAPPPTPTDVSHSRANSSGSEPPPPPSTPPPSTVAELQARTFAQLKKRRVVPFVVDGLHLVQCSGKDMARENNTNVGDDDDDYAPGPHYSSTSATNGANGTNGNGNYHNNNGSNSSDYHNGNGGSGTIGASHRRSSSWLDAVDSQFYMGLMSALALQPRFLSVTLSQEDAPSLLLDKALVPIFGDSIAGDISEGDLVPIFLDLGSLPLASTGIVCGVAGKLVEEMRTPPETAAGAGGGDGGGGHAESELSYLSTARAGAVIMSSEGSARALKILGPVLGLDELL